MPDQSATSIQPWDTIGCVNYRLRRAARKAARLYDHALKPSGLRGTQFTLLAALGVLGEASIGELSDELAIEGTTLTRNLEILVRLGLIANISAADGRVRRLGLTEAGKTAFKRAAPLWQQAQDRMVCALESEDLDRTLADLKRLEVACDIADC